MSEQARIETAIDTTIDNCEVLRARLAKYEDAEGRPLQPAACVSDVVHHSFSRDREIGWNASEEEQALRATFEEWLNKSQFTRPNSPWDIWKASARLNSSPVSSAPSHDEQVRDGWQWVPVEPTPEMLAAGDKYIGTPATYKSMLSACPSPAITKDFSQFLSAVMDAAGLIRHGRQSKELSEYLGMKCMEYRGAALSAPSHGEQVERLQMQLAACGVVALANTPESAARARGMHPDYMSASCGDVIRTVDIQMQLRAELAAMKAQPSGVVRWPEADEIMQMAFEEGQPSEDASGYYFDLEEFDLFIQRLIDEVARLNQPASAGDERSEIWDGKSLPYGWVAVQVLFDGPDYPEDFAYGPPRMMERLSGILERYYATRFASKVEPVNTKGSRKALGEMNAKLRAKIGRLERELAALSANHSEQVREWCEGVEAAVNLIDKKAEDYATEHGHDDMGGLSFGTGQHAQIKADYHSSLIELAAEVLGLIAAAPSAGSQKGGE